jgi:ADP-ribose pyrophosphatase YjhB (NUDIX family)
MAKTVTCVDINGKKYDVSVSDLTWRPSAYGIVIKDKKILLSKQFVDGYDLPGGGIDLGESLEEAVVREVKEETGINVSSPKLLDVKSNFFKMTHDNGACHQSLLFYYECEFIDGEFSIDGFDEQEKEYAEMPEWIPLEDLPRIKVKSSFDWRKIVEKL